MPSSKGIPTHPELREHLKEGKATVPYLDNYRGKEGYDCILIWFPSLSIEIQQEPNKSGDGKGQWAAWKGMKLAKEYEAHGGSYENDPGSKNEPKMGAPVAKSESKEGA